jgi:hypothetical protein
VGANAKVMRMMGVCLQAALPIQATSVTLLCLVFDTTFRKNCVQLVAVSGHVLLPILIMVSWLSL